MAEKHTKWFGEAALTVTGSLKHGGVSTYNYHIIQCTKLPVIHDFSNKIEKKQFTKN